MTFEEFMGLVLNMRISQKAYFKDRRKSDLIKARELEKAVDDAVVAWAIAARATPAQPDQPTLFGDEQ